MTRDVPQSLSFPLAHPRANDSVDWRHADSHEVLLTPLPEAEQNAYSKTFPVPRGEMIIRLWWDVPCRDTTSLKKQIQKDLHKYNLLFKSSRDMSFLNPCVIACKWKLYTSVTWDLVIDLFTKMSYWNKLVAGLTSQPDSSCSSTSRITVLAESLHCVWFPRNKQTEHVLNTLDKCTPCTDQNWPFYYFFL